MALLGLLTVPEGTAVNPGRFNMRRCGFRKLVLDLHDRTLYKCSHSPGSEHLEWIERDDSKRSPALSLVPVHDCWAHKN